MESALSTMIDRDLARLVAAISDGYREGTLAFVEEHRPSFRERLDMSEERVGRLRDDLLAGQVTLAEWRAALDGLRGLWEAVGHIRADDEREAARAEEMELATVGP